MLIIISIYCFSCWKEFTFCISLNLFIGILNLPIFFWIRSVISRFVILGWLGVWLLGRRKILFCLKKLLLGGIELLSCFWGRELMGILQICGALDALQLNCWLVNLYLKVFCILFRKIGFIATWENNIVYRKSISWRFISFRFSSSWMSAISNKAKTETICWLLFIDRLAILSSPERSSQVQP